MIRRSAKESSRKPFSLLLFVIIPFVVIYLIYFLTGMYALPKERTTVLFLTDPVEVASFEPSEEKWIRVQFPASTHIAGIQGLGDYAVDSLWNIAATEGSPSAVVLGSVTDELGVPIDYYVGTEGKIWSKQTDDIDISSMYFSFTGIMSRILGKLDTSLPLPLYIALTKSLRSTESHTIRSVFLENGRGLIERKLPDSSTVLEFDRDQFDGMTDDIFEDRQIRDERLRVAVYNTTGRPFLGSRVARIIDRTGSNVIQVGNEDTSLEECELSGIQKQLDTKTASTIRQLFHCVSKVVSEEGRADLTVRIGRVYERRFLPKE